MELHGDRGPRRVGDGDEAVAGAGARRGEGGAGRDARVAVAGRGAGGGALAHRAARRGPHRRALRPHQVHARRQAVGRCQEAAAAAAAAVV